jgi:uncharacterized Zn finger protein
VELVLLVPERPTSSLPNYQNRFLFPAQNLDYASMPSNTHDETLDNILATLSREQLQEFLVAECERSPDTRDRLFARFGDTAAMSASEYRETVTERFDEHTEQYPVVTGPIDFSDLFDRAEQYRERGRHRAAATVYRGLFEGIDDRGHLIEGGYDQFARSLQRALDGYTDCVAALDPGPETFEEYAAPLDERASTEKGFAGHREQFHRTLADLEERCGVESEHNT